jgi:hypothetical protein
LFGVDGCPFGRVFRMHFPWDLAYRRDGLVHVCVVFYQ